MITELLYEIKVELKGIEPAIWCVLKVPSSTSLLRLHRVLQRVMGWTDSHLHLFQVEGKLYSEPGTDWDIEVLDSRKMTLDKIFTEGRTSFLYEYDMGDSWRHQITLLGMVEGEAEAEEKLACPPEDCGSTMGYYALLVALSDPDHEDHDTMLEWVGGKFDPESFEVAVVDRALKRLR